MKNFSKKVLAVLLALLPCFQTDIMAINNELPTEIPVTPNDPPKPKPNPKPRSRARYTVNDVPACYYYEGEVTIEAESSIASITATVTRLDDNEQFTGASTGNVLTIQVSEDPGTYVLTFTLSNGTGYYGEYTHY